jgi:hypothetical protein
MNRSQNLDQSAKGGLIGVLFALGVKAGVDTSILIALSPLVAALLAQLSTKVGDPTIASFIGAKAAQKKPLTVKKAAKKAAAK